MVKHFILGAAVLLLGLSMAGCGSTAETTTTTTTASTTTATATTTTTTTTTTTLLATVTGRLTYPAASDAAMAGVLVTLESTAQTATTDADGRYQFLNVASGSHTITFYRNGWSIYPSQQALNISSTYEAVNATLEITSMSKLDSGTTKDLNYVSYDSTTGQACMGGFAASIPIFLWYAGSNLDLPAGSGLPDGKELMWADGLSDTIGKVYVFTEDGIGYYSTNSGESFTANTDLGNIDLGRSIEYFQPLEGTNGYVLDGSDKLLYYTADFCASPVSWTAVTMPSGSDKPHSTYMRMEESGQDYNGDGDAGNGGDIIMWFFKDSGLWYSSDNSPTTRTWVQVTAEVEGEFRNGAILLSDGGSVHAGYIVTSSALYRVSGTVQGGPQITLTEVFSGAPFEFCSFALGDNLPSLENSFIVGDGGLVLKGK